MKATEAAAFAREFAPVLRQYVGDAVAPLVERIRELEARPVHVPKDGVGIAGVVKNSDGVLVLTLSDGRIEDTGIRDGTSVTRDEIAAIITAEVTKAIADLSLPDKTGESVDIREVIESALARIAAKAEPDAEIIAAAVQAAIGGLALVSRGDVEAVVRDAVGALPKPRDGADADEAAIVETVLARIPMPKDGTSVTAEDVAPVIAAEVTKAVASLPAPKDGVDADPDTVAAIVMDRLSSQIGAVKQMVEAIPEVPELPDIPAMIREAVAAIPTPRDGKDADPEEIAVMVGEAVAKAAAALPVPKDGADADEAAIVETVLSRIPKPADGKDVDPEAVAALVKTEVGKAVEALPKPQDGKDADPEEIKSAVEAGVAEVVKRLPDVIEAEVSKAVESLPTPKDGQSVTVDDVRPLIVAEIEKAVAEIPVPRDGKDADPEEIAAMIEEKLTKAVAALPPPKDGVGLADMMIADGELIATLADGQMKKLGRVIGPPGLGFEDITVDYDGERCVMLKFIRGDDVLEFPIQLPVVLDRGVYREGKDYEKGDGVTCKSSFWIAQRDTNAKPDEANSDWRLAVKRGRDGKDFRPQGNS